MPLDDDDLDEPGQGERLNARLDDLRATFHTSFDEYAAACLKIKAESGALVPLVLNRSQWFLHQRLEAQRKEKGRVRALVLKGRRIGISTYIGGRFYWRGTHHRGYRTFILAHLDDASNNLFEIAKRYHDNCPEPFRPQTGAANAKELSFPLLDGGYKVATAGSKDVGRSDTLQLFHGSEVAFWPNADKHFAGVMQALANTDGSECVLESTANGPGGMFYTLWKAAQRGDSEFEAIFIPWFWFDDYERDAPADWCAPLKFVEYGDLYDLSPQQIYWAWHKNRDFAHATDGTVDEPCWKFKQEYPANAQEAFESSGDDSFVRALSVMRARKATGIRPYGPIIIGVDPARGGRDKTAIIDRQGRVMGRHICKRVDFGHDTMPIAGEIIRLFRDLRGNGESVFVTVDTGGVGGGLYDRLKELLPRGHCIPIIYGGRAWNEERYANRRAEIWDMLREWVEDPAGVSCPDRDDFQGDVCAPIRGRGATRCDSNGRLILESKEHIDERLNMSPDLGDAAANTFAVDMGVLMQPGPEDDEDDDDDAARHYARNPVTGY